MGQLSDLQEHTNQTKSRNKHEGGNKHIISNYNEQEKDFT